MTEHAVVIVGAGPTGLMLAGELALAGVDVVVVERRANQELDGARAGGLLSRTIEVLDQRGIADRFLSEGQTVKTHGFAGIRLDISDFPTRHPYVLALFQQHIERILAGWVGELRVPVHREREVIGFVQHDLGVDIELDDGHTLRAQYLVGCDGGRSLVRRTAGIEFAGWEAATSFLIAEVEMADEPESGMRHDEIGVHALHRMGDGGRFRLVLTERDLSRRNEPTLQDLSEALIAVYGTDYGVHSPSWISSFTDAARQAEAYRDRRVLLAGDAAHIHPPHGGQGLNTGVQDAVNLGWKLAQVVHGTSPPSLLDSYHAERHPVGARVLQNTLAQVALSKGDARHQALRDTMTDLLEIDQARERIAAMLCGLDIRYDLGDGHPLLGRRVPDLDLETPSGPQRVFTALHQAKALLLNLAEPGVFDITPWAGRVQRVDATHCEIWRLPVLGEVTAPNALLVRPDGHVAWVGDLGNPSDPSLPDALATWCGAGLG